MIENLILENAQKDLKLLTTKEKHKEQINHSVMSENSITGQYLRIAKEGNYEAEIWIKNQLI